MQTDLQQVSFADIAKKLAAGDENARHFHAKAYSIILPDHAMFGRFAEHAIGLTDAVPGKHPVAILTCDLSTMDLTSGKFVPHVDDEGKLIVHFSLAKMNFMKAHQLLFVSPFSVVDGTSTYASALEAIAFVRSLLALYFGNLVTYTEIAEFDFDIDGKVSVASGLFRMPMFADAFKYVNFAITPSLIDRLSKQLPDYRRRLQTASNFLSRAMSEFQEDTRFLLYWISLEVIAGKSGAILSLLTKAYGQKQSWVNETLRFQEIARLRHDLVHNGASIRLLTFHERLMQLFFWDMIYHQIGLPHQGFARLLIESGVVEEELARKTSQ